MEELFRSTPYVENTQGIEIRACPFYVPKQSRPLSSLFVYVYFIRIFNRNDFSVQLKSRKWIIKDATKHEEIVTGPGVVGQFPLLKPNTSYTYSSFCPLKTPTGNMRGEYHFSQPDLPKAPSLIVKIPLFFLRTDQTMMEQAGSEQQPTMVPQ